MYQRKPCPQKDNYFVAVNPNMYFKFHTLAEEINYTTYKKYGVSPSCTAETLIQSALCSKQIQDVITSQIKELKRNQKNFTETEE